MSKACIKCGEVLPLSEFYKHSQMADGHLNKCKKCVKAYQRERPTNRAYEYSRRYLPHRVEARKRYAESKRGREVGNKAKKAWSERNRNKKSAAVAVNNAVRDGRLVKPERCEHCLEVLPLQGHHEDYRKPLEVIWLCVECHNNLHAVYRTVGRKIPA